MFRTQIQLTEEQAEKLKRASRHLDISVAELIRRAIEHYPLATGADPKEDRKEAAVSVVGKFSAGARLSVEHDAVLGEEP